MKTMILMGLAVILAICCASCGMSMGMCVSVDDSKDLSTPATTEPSGGAEVVSIDVETGEIHTFGGEAR